MKRVGIPRALFYYNLYPLWETFFTEIGAEIVLSDKSSKKILDTGSKSCVDQACLPVKIFFGHVIDLCEKDIDYIFIPRLTSISKKEYICPKLGGIPDMIRHNINNLPQIIDTEINLYKSQKNAVLSAIEIGKYFNPNKRKITMAFKHALKDYYEFRNIAKENILPIDILEHKLTLVKSNKDYSLNIALLGHSYNLFDNYINMNLINKLKNSNINIKTIEMFDSDDINKNHNTLYKKMFWNFGRKALGSAMSIAEKNNLDGVIYVMSFGCGIDSFVADMVERKIRNKTNIPFIVLTIDEHSGEAGMNTRLEAFVDMIKRRKNNDNNLSTYGKCLY